MTDDDAELDKKDAEIERLRDQCSSLVHDLVVAEAEVERLRAALRGIVAWLPDESIRAADLARAVLEGK